MPPPQRTHIVTFMLESVSTEKLVAWATRVRGMPGCRACFVSEDIMDRAIRHVHLEWETKAHFIAFLRSGSGLMSEGISLSLWEATQFMVPNIRVSASGSWGQADRRDLTKTEGKLFFLSKANRTQHALFNNSDDQYDVVMKFPRQEMTPCEGVNREVDGDEVRYSTSVFPGQTTPFVNGKWNGGYSLDYKWGPVSDKEYLQQAADSISASVSREIEDFKSFLAENGISWDHPRGVHRSYKFQKKVFDLCIQRRRPYIDLSFLPIQANIDPRPGADRKGWMRPQDYLAPEYKERFRLVVAEGGRGIEPGDIDQGSLGDCWFMAALAACAELPEQLVQPLFTDVNKDKSAEQRQAEIECGRRYGAFKVRLAKNGWWRWHIVDTFLPVLPVTEPNLPLFAHNKEQPAELWVAIVEKVYAKLHGSYQDLAGGDPGIALSDLTGFPSLNMENWPQKREKLGPRSPAEDIRTWDTLFKAFKYHHKKHRMLWVTTPGVDQSDYMDKAAGGAKTQQATQRAESVGLVSGHAYSILSVLEMDGGPGGESARLVLIRNPWGGAREWSGPWSDSSSLWTEHPMIANEAQRLGGECIPGYQLQAEDGTFWMGWDDVREYFDSGGVCLRHGGNPPEQQWQDVRFRTGFRDGLPAHFVMMEVEADCKCIAFASQHDGRGLEASDPRKKPCALRVDVISRRAGSRQYDTLATSQNGVFMYTNQVVATEPPQSDEDFDDAVTLRAGRTYYFLVRQHPLVDDDDLRNRDGIVLTIMTSPGQPGWRKARGFRALNVDAEVSKSFAYKGYHGLAADGSNLARIHQDGEDADDTAHLDLSVQLDGVTVGTDGLPLAADCSNWPSQTRRW
eukprot:TRINITY_DN32542_c0_g1_i1.p1 TRINITY_DN32542_c0_g1~~TRINITY_DN32542_c0_g1_i1.p1  ORF type:complete len:850 (+),score=254.32 TRINITY_DN32542_c0_g1_i1:89-2638(+)